MTVFDCHKDMCAFHAEKVTLREDDKREMRERRNTGRTRLEIGLKEQSHPQPAMVHSQGSYAMHTMVQDPDCDYDIDDGVYFREDDLKDTQGAALAPLAVRERVCAALSRDKRFANPAEVHRNCVRQVYQTGYHIDMPTYRIRVRNPGTAFEETYYELAAGDAWTVSDARSVTRWFKDQVADLTGNDGEDGPQMRRVVRLTKAFARSRDDWKDDTASGITLTALVVECFKPEANRDDVALYRTWEAISLRLTISKIVAHPVNASNLADVGDAKIAFFHEKLRVALTTLDVLNEAACTREKARTAWDSVFNRSFFAKRPDPDDVAKKAFFVKTGQEVDSRDDGGGRYGHIG